MADDDLVRVLAEIQRRGAIGRTSLPDAVDHSDRFVAALPAGARSLIDLGSGGGLPGLVIAHRRRDLQVLLIERRAKRVDLLRFGVRALDLADTVTVYDGDTLTYAVEVAHDPTRRADVVTARAYGPLPIVLETAAALVRLGGMVLVSDPPASANTVQHRAFHDQGTQDGIHRYMFHVEH
jgi:16S rRNA (guanine527-N7)-methyltransferase